MRYYRYERNNDNSLYDYITEFLEDREVYEDVIVNYALANFDDSEVNGEKIVSLGNTLVQVSGSYYEFSDIDEGEDILYIYGYTKISEVVIMHGVV